MTDAKGWMVTERKDAKLRRAAMPKTEVYDVADGFFARINRPMDRNGKISSLGVLGGSLYRREKLVSRVR